jgi:HAD superfamily hydrolase (TIGR01509 family)
MAPKIRAVVFDLDGLMFNTEEIFNRTGRELLSRRGREMTHELLSQMMGRRPREAFTIMIEMMELTDTIEALQIESKDIFEAIMETHLAPMPGLHDVLDLIERRGLPKAVATSSPRAYLEDILQRFHLLDRFPLTLTAEDVTHGKPNPEIYLKAAERLSIAPGEMLVFEDSEAGTLAAGAAGAIVISVPHEHSRLHNFTPATYVASSLHDPYVMELIAAGRPAGPASTA